MALDTLAERGYLVYLDYEKRMVPHYVDPTTMQVVCKQKNLLHFHITFVRPKIRD